MATNLHLDDKLIHQVQNLGHFKFKCEAVNAALREYVQHHGQVSLIEMFGKIDYLRSLKENIIMARLIPAGTGFKFYRGVEIRDEKETEAEKPAEDITLQG